MPDYSFIARGLPPIDIASPLMQVESMRRARAEDQRAEQRNALFAASEQRQADQFRAATEERTAAKEQQQMLAQAKGDLAAVQMLRQVPFQQLQQSGPPPPEVQDFMQRYGIDPSSEASLQAGLQKAELQARMATGEAPPGAISMQDLGGGYKVATQGGEPFGGLVAPKEYSPSEEERFFRWYSGLSPEQQKRFDEVSGPRGGSRQPAYRDIVDPSDPSRLITIDGNMYRGGGLGSPGVIGVAGKEPSALKREEQRGTSRQAVDELVTTLKDQFDQLNEKGGITNTEGGVADNISASLASSGPGQAAGKMLGTKNQSLRNQIQQTRPRLLTAVMAATGMSARQLDSNAELKLWLSAATDPTLDYQANMAALDNILQLYGTDGSLSASGGKPQDGGGAPAAAGGADQFEVGKEYVDGDGNRAVYRGNGQWEPK